MPYEVQKATSLVRKVFLPDQPYVPPHRSGYAKARNIAASLKNRQKVVNQTRLDILR